MLVPPGHARPPYKTVHLHAPEWLGRQIFHLELAAAYLALVLAGESGCRGPLLLGADNAAAIDSLVTGNAKDPVPRSLVGLFWQAVRFYELCPWVEYTRASCNIADAPSRWCSMRHPPAQPLYVVHRPPARFASTMSSLNAVCRAATCGVDSSAPSPPANLKCPAPAAGGPHMFPQ